jgi:hypothetical protein
VDLIYPSELEIKDTTESSTSASYLGLLLKIDTGGNLTRQISDKLDDFISPLSISLIYVAISHHHMHIVSL